MRTSLGESFNRIFTAHFLEEERLVKAVDRLDDNYLMSFFNLRKLFEPDCSQKSSPEISEGVAFANKFLLYQQQKWHINTLNNPKLKQGSRVFSLLGGHFRLFTLTRSANFSSKGAFVFDSETHYTPFHNLTAFDGAKSITFVAARPFYLDHFSHKYFLNIYFGFSSFSFPDFFLQKALYSSERKSTQKWFKTGVPIVVPTISLPNNLLVSGLTNSNCLANAKSPYLAEKSSFLFLNKKLSSCLYLNRQINFIYFNNNKLFYYKITGLVVDGFASNYLQPNNLNQIIIPVKQKLYKLPNPMLFLKVIEKIIIQTYGMVYFNKIDLTRDPRLVRTKSKRNRRRKFSKKKNSLAVLNKNSFNLSKNASLKNLHLIFSAIRFFKASSIKPKRWLFYLRYQKGFLLQYFTGLQDFFLPMSYFYVQKPSLLQTSGGGLKPNFCVKDVYLPSSAFALLYNKKLHDTVRPASLSNESLHLEPLLSWDDILTRLAAGSSRDYFNFLNVSVSDNARKNLTYLSNPFNKYHHISPLRITEFDDAFFDKLSSTFLKSRSFSLIGGSSVSAGGVAGLVTLPYNTLSPLNLTAFQLSSNFNSFSEVSDDFFFDANLLLFGCEPTIPMYAYLQPYTANRTHHSFFETYYVRAALFFFLYSV